MAGLMTYLLNGGRALYQMEKWAEESAALDHIFPDYQPSDWTDDRLDDTLDELYKVGLEPMQGSISANIITEFGLNLDDIHFNLIVSYLFCHSSSSLPKMFLLLLSAETSFSKGRN